MREVQRETGRMAEKNRYKQVKRKKKIKHVNHKYILKANEVEISKSTQSKIIKRQKR
jgi:hypothetical protein